MTEPPGELLDTLARTVFEAEQGKARLGPLLARFDAEVGTILEDDRHRDLLLAIRLDWALCDAAIESGRGPGDTWLRRAVAGELAGIEGEQWSAIAASHVGLFEVWSGTRPFLRDMLHGVSVVLRDAVHLEPMPVGPAALWEARILIEDGEARLCRSPLPYPLEIHEWLEERAMHRFRPEGAPLELNALRKRWLQFHRAPRADAVSWFALALRE